MFAMHWGLVLVDMARVGDFDFALYMGYWELGNIAVVPLVAGAFCNDSLFLTTLLRKGTGGHFAPGLSLRLVD